ncbi:Concanavalin A-like lectin/glucanase, subgroup [Artemisia annua]|uniref:Concanavalin A-like lectin/glucanase, subgroup n=1 Tax=Artemisia annua TaxID=35608 RepID=A0A2U1NNJ1_ARTAN|nr:Concanavalin A-like lectin/glucanase, subgroup [Artemisia annua]
MLKNLEVLDLSSNEFDGEMGDKIFDLPLLRVLDISDNKISGGVPGGICLNSTGLRVVKLAVNNLTAGLPRELRECRSLEHLCLASNKITGVVPAFLLELPSLKELDLQDNLLNDTSELNETSLFSGVTRLDFSLNRFSGSLPDFFDKFPNLTSFCARSNRFTGGMPKSLVNSRAISVINLRNNSLSGALKFNCSVMVNLTSVDLGTNNFSGFIPSDLSSCHKLRALNLARNKFIGEIPESFKEFKSLSYLSLSNCSFTNLESSLKILQHVPNLTVLVLTMNFRGEMLPVDSILHFKALKALVIANCGLTGNIPLWLNGLTQLQLLDLSWNKLTGSVPSYLGDFKSLFYLDLSNNSLSGEIPKSLTQLPCLSFGNVSLEEGSPDFPFFTRPNMSSRGSALQYNRIMSFPPLIDLSHNFINGSIWREFGNLKQLHVLDLKHNNLSGGIPSELSGMTSIETLDLSYNNLSGRIPSELVRLSFLSRFSVAYNDLSGTIPTGGQFPTFANSSFEGNKELCGPGCGDLSGRFVPKPSSAGSKKSKVTVVGMAVGIGIGSVFILALMFVIILRATMKQEVDPEREDDNDSKEELEPKLVILFQTKEELSLNDLLKSTNSFDQANIIGCGGFGLVFKATLPDGKNVAIKRLSGDTGQVDREFQAEVETLSRAQHPNLVLLQGRDLISWVMEMKKEKRENEVFDPLIFDKENAEEMLWVLEIACVCLNESPKLRPSTQELVSWLHQSAVHR